MRKFLLVIASLIIFNAKGQVISMSPSETFQGVNVIGAIFKLAPGVMQAGFPPDTITDVFLQQGDSIIYPNAFTTAQIYPGTIPYTDSLTVDFTIPLTAKPGWYEVHVITYDLALLPINNKLDNGFLIRLPGSCPVPFNITSDTVTADGTQEIIGWDPSTVADTFRIRFHEHGTLNYFYKDVNGGGGTVHSDTIKNLYPGALYDVEVSTICSGIHSTYSVPVDTFTPLPQPFNCTIPYSIAISGIANTAATISWTDFVTADTFRIRYYETGTSTYYYLDVSGAGPHNATITNLHPAANYSVQVSAKCLGSGNGYSYVRQFNTVATPVNCVKPWGADTNNVTNSSATIFWSSYVTADTFRIRYSVNGTTNYLYKNVPGNAGNTATITGLNSNTTYQYQVSSVCVGLGNGYTPSRLFTTQSIPVFCGIPHDLLTTGITNASADISWSPLVSADSFLIRYSVDPTTNYIWKKVPGTVHNTTLTGLSPLTNYQWQVRSLCSSLPSSYSPQSTFSTPLRFANSTVLNYDPEFFPNPATDFLNIKFFSTTAAESNLQIVDLLGRTILNTDLHVDVGLNERQIDVAFLNRGVYYVLIDGVHRTKMILGQ